MSDLLAEVDQQIARHRLLQRGEALIVAVSGGLDSMVLLQVLIALAPQHNWRLTVAHLNHQLRGKHSDADQRLVRQTAASHKLPFIWESANVRRHVRQHGLSIEMAARHLRHEFLARTAKKRRIGKIALAHHGDDQLELFFLRLFRGTSTDALAGMKWQNPSPANPRVQLIRPLLNCPKSELFTFARENNVRFREDATNRSLKFPRNRIRLELLPLLRKHYQPGLDKTIARTSEILRAESELLNALACLWLSAGADVRRPKPPMISGFGHDSNFEQLPTALQRRVLYVQLIELGLQPDFDLIEHLRTTANSPVTPSQVPSAQSRTRINPIRLFRDIKGKLQTQIAHNEQFTTNSLSLDLCSKSQATFDHLSLQWHFAKPASRRPRKNMNGHEFFDADKIGPKVFLRHWQRGDRFQPSGMSKPVKLQDLFTNAKIPRNLRHDLIVATNARGEIFWVESLRIGERFKLTKDTIRVLQWRWQRALLSKSLESKL